MNVLSLSTWLSPKNGVASLEASSKEASSNSLHAQLAARSLSAFSLPYDEVDSFPTAKPYEGLSLLSKPHGFEVEERLEEGEVSKSYKVVSCFLSSLYYKADQIDRPQPAMGWFEIGLFHLYNWYLIQSGQLLPLACKERVDDGSKAEETRVYLKVDLLVKTFQLQTQQLERLGRSSLEERPLLLMRSVYERQRDLLFSMFLSLFNFHNQGLDYGQYLDTQCEDATQKEELYKQLMGQALQTKNCILEEAGGELKNFLSDLTSQRSINAFVRQSIEYVKKIPSKQFEIQGLSSTCTEWILLFSHVSSAASPAALYVLSSCWHALSDNLKPFEELLCYIDRLQKSPKVEKSKVEQAQELVTAILPFVREIAPPLGLDSLELELSSRVLPPSLFVFEDDGSNLIEMAPQIASSREDHLEKRKETAQKIVDFLEEDGRFLNLSRMQLHEVPFSLNHTLFFQHLLHLNLASNGLESLPDNFFSNLTKLEQLDLSFNPLKEIGPKVALLQKIDLLFLNGLYLLEVLPQGLLALPWSARVEMVACPKVLVYCKKHLQRVRGEGSGPQFRLDDREFCFVRLQSLSGTRLESPFGSF